MAAFAGKWKLTKSDDNAAFLSALGYTPTVVAGWKKFTDPSNDWVTEYIFAGHNVTEVLHCKGEQKLRHEYTLGKEREFTDPAKRTSKLVTTVEGNVMTTMQKLDGEYEAKYVNKLEGNTMIQTKTTKNVSSVKTFVKV